MKKAEIKVGGHYWARVSGNLVTVRVDSIGLGGLAKRQLTTYRCTNLKTARKVTFKSAAKFRSEVKYDVSGGSDVKEAEGYKMLSSIDKATAKKIGYFGDGPDGSDPLRPRTVEDIECELAEAEKELRSEVSEEVIPTPSIGLASRLSQRVRSEDLSNGRPCPPHLIIEARAGTGKTTTLVEGLKVMRGQPSKLTPSPQQAAIWNEMQASHDAKTICFVAFNKSIATELQSRVPQGCEAMTMHSMGFKAVQRAFGRLEPNQYVVQDIISELLGVDIRDLRKTKPIVIKATEDLVGLCKMNLTELYPPKVVEDVDEAAERNNEALSKLASHYEVDLSSDNGRSYKQEVFTLVPQVLQACCDPAKRRKIDFNDMIWLPIVLDLPIVRYDLLLVDEAQDLNRCQQALAKRAGQRLILCGDPKQAIYGFAGADSESMKRMAEELGTAWNDPNRSPKCPRCGTETVPDWSDAAARCTKCGYIEQGCIVLPLTVTHRCGRAIVREANQIVPDFKAHESNPEGVVSQAKYPTQKVNGETKELPWEETYAARCLNGDMVLCRVNAPLVSQCFRFLKRGIKATIQGRDVGKGLIATVTKVAGKEPLQVVGFITKLTDWHHAEVSKEQAKKFPNEAKVIGLNDRVDCLICFTDGATTTDDVIRKIESVFTDDKNVGGIKLSSIHKAKGLEAHRVFLLEPEGATVPHPMARSAWQIEQEYNLRYVAITRAIEELVFVI